MSSYSRWFDDDDVLTCEVDDAGYYDGRVYVPVPGLRRWSLNGETITQDEAQAWWNLRMLEPPPQ